MVKNTLSIDKQESNLKKNYQINDSNELLELQRSYGTIQIISILIAGFCMSTLLDGYIIGNIQKNKTIHIATGIIFVVFCTNLLVSSILSTHISHIYYILGDGDQKKETTEKRYDDANLYHKKTFRHLNIISELGWFSLPLLVLGVGLYLINKYDMASSIFFKFIIFIFVTIFLVMKYWTNSIFKEILYST
jgi:hypothetical protein